MNIPKAVVLILLSAPLGVSAADWKPLSGTYAVTAENYLDPAAEEPKNSHFRLQLTGNAAKELYMAIPGKPSTDACTGAQSKASGELRCLYFKEGSNYECAFSIDLLEGAVEYGVAC